MGLASTFVLVAILVGAASALAQEPPELPEIEQVPVSVELTFYDVEGRSQRALDSNLRLRGPLGYDADTHYELSWFFEFWDDDDGCAVTFIEVPLHIRIRYPNWLNRGRASRRMRQAWDRRMHALEVHENGHSLIAYSGALEAYNAAVQFPGAATCEALQDGLSAVFDDAVDVISHQQREYDRITDHGLRQADYDWTPILGQQPDG
jgi:predicted secreted Zn-dependent protease